MNTTQKHCFNGSNPTDVFSAVTETAGFFKTLSHFLYFDFMNRTARFWIISRASTWYATVGSKIVQQVSILDRTSDLYKRTFDFSGALVGLPISGYL